MDQGLNSCLLYWQADPLPLNHQDSPYLLIWLHWVLAAAYGHLVLCPGIKPVPPALGEWNLSH